jgi:hypothetical protein
MVSINPIPVTYLVRAASLGAALCFFAVLMLRRPKASTAKAAITLPSTTSGSYELPS